MKNFFIIANYAKPHTLFCVQKVQDYLTAKGAVCAVARPAAPDDERFHYTDTSDIPAGTEAIIVLGGDGTLIQAAHDIRGTQYPLIGVNLGNLGYLAEVDEESLFTALDRLLNDEYVIEERMALMGEIIRGHQVLRNEFALNDIVLARMDSMKMIRFSLWVNGNFLTRYDADGMIVSTPTGSTAYNMSAGGPILLPTAFQFVLSSICAHTMFNARSIVLPDDVSIELVVETKPGGRKDGQAVCFDSDNAFSLTAQDRIRICKAEDNVRLIRLNDTGFLETLAKKFSR